MARETRARSGKQAARRSANLKGKKEVAKPKGRKIIQRIVVPDAVKKVYKTIQQQTGSVGGYGHDGPVYGEITMGSMQKIINFLKENCDFDCDSMFLDVGAGLGKPNLHAAIDPGVRASIGIEVEQLRWVLSLKNLQSLLAKRQVPNKVCMLQRDVTDVATFNPFTVVYMFDVGFPPNVLVSMANCFNRSSTVKNLVSFHPPRDIIGNYGFRVELIDGLSTSMAGSSETHKVYIYKSTNEPSLESVDAPDETAVIQTQISSFFRGSRVRARPDELTKNVSAKKQKLAKVQVEKKNTALEDDGNQLLVASELDLEIVERKVQNVDVAFKQAFDLLSDGDNHAWIEQQVEDFFMSGRSSRRTRASSK